MSDLGLKCERVLIVHPKGVFVFIFLTPVVPTGEESGIKMI